MLQVARLSPKQLGDARDLVQHFLLEQRHPDGGFQDRSGDPDIYYTVFGLEGLVALQAEPPIDASPRTCAASARATGSTSCISRVSPAPGRP